MKDFLQLESASGILLMVAAMLAMIAANSPAADMYAYFIDTPVEIRIGALQIAKPLLLWVNDGLMAIFFFLVGLELKREFLEGELSRPANIMLPALGAVGGMGVPVAIFVWFNYGDTAAMQGWAIPAATDIAFALGILMLLGSRVPVSLKVFLVSLAIFDDLGAIVIIAVFYSSDLSVNALVFGGLCLVLLGVMNWRGVATVSPYVVVGIIMWIAVLKSGVHATLAGVALAAFIPMRDPDDPAHSPLKNLEHDLHSVVAFGVLPLFAFVNAGISLQGIGLSSLLHPVPMGIALGLFAGKQLGIFLLCYLAIKTGLARLPDGANWGSLYGVSILCGVGFTMSLFVGSLAFENVTFDASAVFDERLGIIVGSLLSGILGYVVLHWALPKSD
ncbi:MAG: Na+/H+ antiporter NhaA [Gammaproteobacteria bacterium]|nr:Na+/H+ antiporter NhaA [Gammaproteobacteria bacterium]MDH5241066.1 Na+/H+ antiporter NhaA [Gammaproteobacteria bacterium]MDH5260159.1 Na+/H+ antiporter NhaA [Gammaproteobacteria bacterium]MDH5584859.1 Na+/H+ antiporter NhaA [Gammaproteobacteria bacterium]